MLSVPDQKATDCIGDGWTLMTFASLTGAAFESWCLFEYVSQNPASCANIPFRRDGGVDERREESKDN